MAKAETLKFTTKVFRCLELEIVVVAPVKRLDGIVAAEIDLYVVLEARIRRLLLILSE